MAVELFHWQPRVPPFGLPQRLPIVNAPTWMLVPSRKAANFGDELGPIVVRHILAAERLRSPEQAPADTRLFSVGSVLHFARPGDHVWGSGINGKKRRPLTVAPGDIVFHAVRGPRTREHLMNSGFDVPAVYGDPALLLPTIAPEYALSGTEKRRKIALIPNLNDAHDFRRHPDFVSPLQDPLTVAREIAASEMVIGSSLHAMILADAIGVPSRPMAAHMENPFKYDDYYSGTARELPQFARTIAEAIRLGPVEPWNGKSDALLASFPRELFDLPRR